MKLQDIYKDVRGKLPSGDITTALEIGPGEGKFCNALQESGVLVTAIDKERSSNIHPQVRFETMSFEDYIPDKPFDLVHARNVIPFFKNKPEQLARMLSMGRYVYFTFFGPSDPWAEKGMTISKDEMLPVLKSAKILYWKEEQYEGSTMKGDIKPWHVFTYLVQTGI